MKNCPFCAEEIQDQAIVCKHCGRELVPLQLATKPLAQAGPVYPVSLPPNPALAPVVQAYAAKGYKVVASSGDAANLERPAAQFSYGLFFVLIFLFGVGAIVYVMIHFIWANRKSYRVQLVVGPDGRVQELGDTLLDFENNRMRANQKRSAGFGALLCGLGAFVVLMAVLALIGGFADQTTPWYEVIFSSFLFLVFGNLFTGLPGLFLLLQSRKIKQKLDVQSAGVTLQAV